MPRPKMKTIGWLRPWSMASLGPRPHCPSSFVSFVSACFPSQASICQKRGPKLPALWIFCFLLGSETPDRAMTMLCTRIFQDILMGGDAAKLYLVEDILRNAHSVFHAKSPLCPEGFELLAHVFEFMTTHPEHVQSLERMMSDICDAAPWRWDQTVQLISMLRELPLGESCQLMIVTKIRESQFPANPPDDDVPALVYQTLLLASSVPTSEKRALFKAISLLFPDIVQNPALTPREWLVLKTRLLAKESMTLNHMWTILQHDPVIRSEYLSYLKTLTRSGLTPFNVSLMLLLSRNMQCRVVRVPFSFTLIQYGSNQTMSLVGVHVH
ncbi:hypothetical protein BC828DRAFT_112546 [Blastocladiella britannica]|nr:hypothetical protein BC828DRAFT_112546 [Blastocladiella britannica]